MSGSEEAPKKIGKNWITFLLFLLILYFGIRFLSTDGNSHPLVANLFNMTILLSFFSFISIKMKSKKEKKKLLIKPHYLNILKKNTKS